MYSVPEILEVPFIMNGTTARRESSAMRLSNPDMNMENLLVPAIEWLTLHPIDDADGGVLPAIPRLPQRPPDLAANANATQ